jgi:diguanylate cyclase
MRLYGIEVQKANGETMMLQSPESPRIPMKRMERLSEVIIESLQELSSSNQPLSTTSLCRALAPRREFADLITAFAPNERDHQGDRQVEEQVLALEARIQKGQDRERDLVGQIDKLEAHISKALEFQKKSTTALIVLARKRKDKRLASALDRLKSLVLNDADLFTLEECLQEIKQVILNEQDASGSDSNSRGSIAATFRALTGAGRSEADPKEKSQFLPQVQKAFLTILGQFIPISGEKHLRRFLDLEKRIKTCDDMEAVLALGQDLIDIIHDYVGYASEEQSQVAHFVTELGKNLLEMETQLKTSVSDAQETYLVNKDFNNAVQGQVEDIKESFSINRTLEEIRGFVLSKLKAIRIALDRKRKQDEIQLENTNQKMIDLQTHLQSMKTEIDQVHKRTKILEEEVQLDSLIGIHNRRAYELRMQEELQRFQRYNQTFSLVMFDVDHFKRVNDQYGHKTGDRCLTEIVNRIRPSLRKSDFLARYGGEEFVIILTGTPKENAHKLAEKLRVLIEKTCFVCQGQAIPVTISLGVTEVRPDDLKPEDVFARVDEAMYTSKREGRNRVSQL